MFGAVIDPAGLAELLPDWKELGAPLTRSVTADKVKVIAPGTGQSCV